MRPRAGSQTLCHALLPLHTEEEHAILGFSAQPQSLTPARRKRGVVDPQAAEKTIVGNRLLPARDLLGSPVIVGLHVVSVPRNHNPDSSDL